MQHVREDHKPSIIQCELCKRTFTRSTTLKEHLKLHSHGVTGGAIVSVPCTVAGCPKVFTSTKNMKTHVKIIHEGFRPFQCDINGCSQSFGYKHLYLLHRLRHEKLEQRKQEEASSISITKDSHRNMIDTMPSQLVSYITGFDKHRIHRCPECNHTYKQRSHLKRHIASIHGGTSLDLVDGRRVSSYIYYEMETG
jgi:uncharacterized Zn-finger protein